MIADALMAEFLMIVSAAALSLAVFVLGERNGPAARAGRAELENPPC